MIQSASQIDLQLKSSSDSFILASAPTAIKFNLDELVCRTGSKMANQSQQNDSLGQGSSVSKIKKII